MWRQICNVSKYEPSVLYRVIRSMHSQIATCLSRWGLLLADLRPLASSSPDIWLTGESDLCCWGGGCCCRATGALVEVPNVTTAAEEAGNERRLISSTAAAPQLRQLCTDWESCTPPARDAAATPQPPRPLNKLPARALVLPSERSPRLTVSEERENFLRQLPPLAAWTSTSRRWIAATAAAAAAADLPPLTLSNPDEAIETVRDVPARATLEADSPFPPPPPVAASKWQAEPRDSETSPMEGLATWLLEDTTTPLALTPVVDSRSFTVKVKEWR